jgi:hypothetical protein
VQGLPKLTGSIDRMPTKAFAGDLKLLTLNLRNHSEYAVKVFTICFPLVSYSDNH